MEKFKKYMGILDKCLDAIGIAFLVVSIVMVAFAIVGFIGIEGVEIGEIDTVLEFGVINLKVDESVIVDAEKSNNLLAASALVAAVQFLVSWFLIKILCELVSPMKEGNIFDPSVHKTIKKLAFWVFLGGNLSECLEHIGSLLICKSYNIDALFNSAAVKTYSLDFEMNGNFIIYAAIIYLLSYVFKYGAELQTQVEETL